MKVIIDTNALMAIGDFGIDIFEELAEVGAVSVFILEGTVQELEKIILEQKGKAVRNAKLALQILKSKLVKTLPSSGNVDDRLVEFSKDGYVVLTQDRVLRARLSKPYLMIRQKNRLVVVD